MSAREIELSKNLRSVEERIVKAASSVGRSPSEITLIAVTKFFPATDAQILYNLGLRNFGENRDNEGAEKSALLPSDAHWHFQGQVQSRKIKSIAAWAEIIHSLDSLDHAAKFNEILQSSERATEVEREFFIQVNLEPERSDRGGVAPSDLADFLGSVRKYSAVKVSGLMAVLPIDLEIEKGFEIVAGLQQKYDLAKLSIGMSNDFEAAIRTGATHIRVGSSILGSRPTLT